MSPGGHLACIADQASIRKSDLDPPSFYYKFYGTGSVFADNTASSHTDLLKIVNTKVHSCLTLPVV